MPIRSRPAFPAGPFVVLGASLLPGDLASSQRSQGLLSHWKHGSGASPSPASLKAGHWRPEVLQSQLACLFSSMSLLTVWDSRIQVCS